MDLGSVHRPEPAFDDLERFAPYMDTGCRVGREPSEVLGDCLVLMWTCVEDQDLDLLLPAWDRDDVRPFEHTRQRIDWVLSFLRRYRAHWTRDILVCVRAMNAAGNAARRVQPTNIEALFVVSAELATIEAFKDAWIEQHGERWEILDRLQRS